MKTGFKNYWFFLAILVLLSCKKEPENPVITVSMNITDANNRHRDAFNEGEDIFFVFQEHNPTRYVANFIRGTNIPLHHFQVFDENNNLVGMPLQHNGFETFELQLLTLNPFKSQEMEINWLNTETRNAPLAPGKYKVVYEGSFKMENPDKPKHEYKLEKEFRVQ